VGEGKKRTFSTLKVELFRRGFTLKRSSPPKKFFTRKGKIQKNGTEIAKKKNQLDNLSKTAIPSRVTRRGEGEGTVPL